MASRGACERLAVLKIDARRQYILLVVFVGFCLIKPRLVPPWCVCLYVAEYLDVGVHWFDIMRGCL